MKKLFRLIDANLNRTREGLRVCEDVMRFMCNDRKAAGYFKSLRHRVTRLAKRIHEKRGTLLAARNVKCDVGKKTIRCEKMRKDMGDVFRANIQRAKESLRVLEEAVKIFDEKKSQEFKEVRFRVYELEKKSVRRLETLLYHR